jgi:dimethylargininase
MIAVVRPPSDAYGNCIRSDRARLIDVALARRQHEGYALALESCGLEVAPLSPEPSMPDACFVEDAAVVVGRVAVITRPGAEARRRETASVEAFLRRFVDCVRLDRGTLDGGDVLVADGVAFVGLSSRTTAEGARRFGELAGLEVRRVPVGPLLHLKTGATSLGGRRLVARRGAFPPGTFAGFDVVETDEPDGSTVLAVGGRVVVSAAAPKTADRLGAMGFDVRAVDIGEFHAGDAGVTCLSLVLSPA